MKPIRLTSLLNSRSIFCTQFGGCNILCQLIVLIVYLINSNLIMKKLARLILVSLIFTFVTTACKEDDENNIDPIENNGITEADLVGNWDFVSLEFEGKTYTECDDQLRKKYDLTNLSFFNVTLESELYGVPSLIYFSNCGNLISSERRFNIEDNYIYLYNETNLKFLILNSQSFNGELLKIKLITNSKSITSGGIYTLQRN